MKRKQGDDGFVNRVEEKRVCDCKLGDGVAWLRGAMIGKGSSGSVYIANSKKPRNPYSYFPPIIAVKSAEVSVSASIQKEREVLSNIEWCPYIIRCFGDEVTTSQNGEMVCNLLLEYGSGGTLAALIKNNSSGGGLPESDVRRYTRSILRGLNHIHGCGYVHCDIKPENVLLVNITSGGVAKFKAKIGDFGLAKRVEKNKKRELNPYLRGTPMYLSPEAVVDCIQEPPSDIWALGCVVLEMLTGKPPWQTRRDQDAESLIGQIGRGRRLPAIPTEMSKEGKDFLKGCFVRTAKFRWTTEMLLNHPFVGGLVEEDGEVEQEDDVFSVDLVIELSENDDDLSSCTLSGDSSFTSEEDDFWSSSKEDIELVDNEVISGFAEEKALETRERLDTKKSSNVPGLEDITEVPMQVSSNQVQQCPVVFTIPAGV